MPDLLLGLSAAFDNLTTQIGLPAAAALGTVWVLCMLCVLMLQLRAGFEIARCTLPARGPAEMAVDLGIPFLAATALGVVPALLIVTAPAL